MNIGDKVKVILPGGEYVGVIRHIHRNYACTGEDFAFVDGDKPVPFETIARVANLAKSI